MDVFGMENLENPLDFAENWTRLDKCGREPLDF